MAYDETLAERITELLGNRHRIDQKRMFGGLCFLVNGHMCCGIVGNQLMVRVGPQRYAAALRRPHARPMDFTGRPLTGFVFVLPEGLRTRQALKSWLTAALRFAASLPTKRA